MTDRHPTSRAHVYALLLVMTLIWGLNFVVAKIGTRYFPVLLLATLRILAASILLAPVWLFVHRRVSSGVTRRDLPRLALLGLLGIGFNQFTYVMGVYRTSVAHASLIFMTMPIQVLLLASMRGQERLNARKLFGMGVALAGVVWLNFAPAAHTSQSSLRGDLTMFLSALAFATFTVWSKQAAVAFGGLTVTTLSHLASAVVLVPIALAAYPDFAWSSVPAAGWWTLVYMAVFPSIVCFMIFHYALKHLPASRLSSFTFLQPLIATISGLTILGEPVTASLAGGGALILGGVFVASRS